MALLTTGEWYEITWVQTSGAAWAALTPPPGIPGAMATDFVNSATMVIYVTDSASGSFTFSGGQATGWDDTLINSQVGPLTKNTWSAGTTDYDYAVDSTGAVWYYDSAAGTLRTFSGPESTAMKAFLP